MKKIKDIEAFVKSATKKKIKVFYTIDKSNDRFFMCVPRRDRNHIVINTACKSKENYFKMALLHEIGHMENRNTNGGKAEYKAQMFAINKAKELNMPKVAKEGIKTITQYWKKVNSCYCRKEHHQAHKIYMRKNPSNVTKALSYITTILNNTIN